MRKLLAARAVLFALAGAAVVFNRGNETVGLIAALALGVSVLAVGAIANYKSPIVLSLNVIGAIIMLGTLTLTKMPTFPRFYIVVVVLSFVQLVAELIVSTRNGWFKKENRTHLISFALHAAIWSVFAWLNPDEISALGVFGTYCMLVAVHLGIDAAGPKREG